MKTTRKMAVVVGLLAVMVAGCAKPGAPTPIAATADIISAINRGTEARFVRTLDTGEWGNGAFARAVFAFHKDMLDLTDDFTAMYGRAEAEKIEMLGFVGPFAFPEDARATMTVKVTGDTAVVTVGKTARKVQCVRRGGFWKLALDKPKKGPPTAAQRRELIEQIEIYREGIQRARKDYLTRRIAERKPEEVRKDIMRTIMHHRRK